MEEMMITEKEAAYFNELVEKHEHGQPLTEVQTVLIEQYLFLHKRGMALADKEKQLVEDINKMRKEIEDIRYNAVEARAKAGGLVDALIGLYKAQSKNPVKDTKKAAKKSTKRAKK